MRRPPSGERGTALTALHKNRKIKSATILIQTDDGTTVLTDSKGGLGEHDEFAIASIAKLYTHAVTFALIDDAALSYDTLVRDLLPGPDLEGLPGIDRVTVRHLIDQNSGFGDYETDRLPDRTVVINSILERDRAVGYDEARTLTSTLKARSQPGAAKAHYANLNAELPGRIASVVTGEPLSQLIDTHICAPLGLTRTRPMRPDEQHWPFFNRHTEVLRPAYISGGLASAGLVSTNVELMRFTRAFFDGELFEPHHIDAPVFRRTQWFPLKYGAGMMQLAIPRFASIMPTPELIGHAGSTGSFAFRVPSRSLTITGTINQLAVRPYSYLYRYLNHVKKHG